MIRIVVKEVDATEYSHVPNGQVYTRLKSFDLNLPELEAYLEEGKKFTYGGREIVGYEVLPN